MLFKFIQKLEDQRWMFSFILNIFKNKEIFQWCLEHSLLIEYKAYYVVECSCFVLKGCPNWRDLNCVFSSPVFSCLFLLYAQALWSWECKLLQIDEVVDLGLPPAPTGFMGFLLHKRRWDPKIYDRMRLKLVSSVMNIMEWFPSQLQFWNLSTAQTSCRHLSGKKKINW